MMKVKVEHTNDGKVELFEAQDIVEIVMNSGIGYPSSLTFRKLDEVVPTVVLNLDNIKSLSATSLRPPEAPKPKAKRKPKKKAKPAKAKKKKSKKK